MQLWSLIISVCPIQVVNILSEEIAACNMKHVMLSLKLIKNVSTAPTFHTLHSTLHTAMAMWPWSYFDVSQNYGWKMVRHQWQAILETARQCFHTFYTHFIPAAARDCSQQLACSHQPRLHGKEAIHQPEWVFTFLDWEIFGNWIDEIVCAEFVQQSGCWGRGIRN